MRTSDTYIIVDELAAHLRENGIYAHRDDGRRFNRAR
jgi:hypothetical protein